MTRSPAPSPLPSKVLRSGLAAVAFLLVAAGSARAADDDFEFADALARRGYTDLAAEIYNNLINDPKSTSAKKAEGQYGIALLTYGDARLMAAERNDKRRAAMADVLKKFDEADAAFAKFISENAGHPRNLEAKLSRGKLLQDKAEYVKLVIENKWLPAGQSPEGWMKQVADWFDTAIQLFADAQKRAQDDLDRAERGSSARDDLNDQVALTWLYRLSTLYGKGAALPKGDPAGTAALNQCAKEGSDDYQWEYGDSVRGLWAIHFAGLACAALDDPAKAFSHLKSAAGFTAEKDPSPAIQDITFQSYSELGKMSLRFGRRDKDDWPKKALEFFGNLDRDWPEWRKHPAGQQAGLVWARLLASQGQADKALAMAQEIAKVAEATASPTRFEATRLIPELLGKGGSSGSGADSGVTLDPQMLTKIARNKWGEQDFRGAIRAFQAAVAACGTPDEMEKFGWDAWDYIGRCYGAQQRYWEAFLAFDVIEQAWRKDRNNEKLNELTNETGYSRAAALDALFRQTKDPADKAAAAKALEEFTTDHPTSPRNLDSETRVAETKYREAEALRADGEAYRAALREVLKAYEGLGAKSKNADLNQATIAQIHQKMASAEPVDVAGLTKAVELADAWLAQKRADSTDSTVRRAREQGRRIALAVALTARATKRAALSKATDRNVATNAATDLLAAVDRYGNDFREVAANGQQQLDEWRAEGLIGSGKVDDADQLVGKILQENAAARNNAYLSGIVAAALEHRALEQLAKGDNNGYRNLMNRSARRSEWVLDNLKLRDGTPAPRNPDVVRAVAVRYSKGGDFTKAEALLLEAQKAYDDLAAAAKNDEEKEKNLRKSRTCRIELIGLLVEQGKFDAAIPQLEKELAKDPKARDSFLRDVQKTDNWNDAQFRDMIAKTDANKALLDQLSAAYMKAASKERCFAAVNLCSILTLTMPKEERHGTDWIEYVMRRGEAYLMLAEYTRQPEHFRAALAAVRNSVVIPGLVDQYENTLPGSKKRGETIMTRAEEGLRKLGSK